MPFLLGKAFRQLRPFHGTALKRLWFDRDQKLLVKIGMGVDQATFTFEQMITYCNLSSPGQIFY